MKDLTFKEFLERIRKQSDRDIDHYYQIFPLASQYHRGYRDAVTDILEEMEKRKLV